MEIILMVLFGFEFLCRETLYVLFCCYLNPIWSWYISDLYPVFSMHIAEVEHETEFYELYRTLSL